MIKVFSPKQTLFAANVLVKQLKKLGHPATVVNSVNVLDTSLHIIYGAGMLERLPPNYILYQTEVKGSTWFNTRYYGFISKAKAVWEYSQANIIAYNRYNHKIAIVGPGIDMQKPAVKDIPYLFYGWLHTNRHGLVDRQHRRFLIVESIKKQLPLTVVTDKFGADMWKLLKRAKVVINVHYYSNAPLEVFRINEALSHGCHVVSERSVSGDLEYKNYAQFGKNSSEIIARAIDCGKIPFEVDTKPLCNLEQIKHGLSLIR